MTDEQTLADAIAEVKRRFVRGRTWDSCDIDVLSIQYYGPSIARILNAAVAGELVPPATECPFGDDCDLTVAYMAGAASKKNASMMTASPFVADDKDAAPQMHVASLPGNCQPTGDWRKVVAGLNSSDPQDMFAIKPLIEGQAATIARLTAERDAALKDKDYAPVLNALAAAKAALAQARDAAFREGVEAAAKEWQNVRVEGGVAVAAVMAYSDRIRALAPQSVDVRDTPTQAQQAGLSDAGAPQADYLPSAITDAKVNEITQYSIGKWPSFEAQSWACKVVRAVLEHYTRADLETCPDCEGTGIGGHPDSGNTCAKCDGCGGVRADPVREAAKVLMSAVAALESLPTRQEVNGGQHYHYVQLGEAIAAIRTLAGEQP